MLFNFSSSVALFALLQYFCPFDNDRNLDVYYIAIDWQTFVLCMVCPGVLLSSIEERMAHYNTPDRQRVYFDFNSLQAAES